MKKSVETHLTAMHEASRAVVYVGLGLRIEQVCILGAGQIAGRVRLTMRDDTDPHALMMGALAGPVGDAIRDQTGAEDMAYHLRHGEAHPDMVAAMEAAGRLHASPGRAWRALCAGWVRVDAWLRLPTSAAAVEAVAGALVDLTIISGDETYALARAQGVQVGDARLLSGRIPHPIGPDHD